MLSSFYGLELLTDKAQILARAQQETIAWTQPEGALDKWNLKRGLKGAFTYDISFRNKGQILTVYVHPGQQANPQELAALKDQLMQLRYNFKTPKGTVYKFTHTFLF